LFKRGRNSWLATRELNREPHAHCGLTGTRKKKGGRGRIAVGVKFSDGEVGLFVGRKKKEGDQRSHAFAKKCRKTIGGGGEDPIAIT